MQTFKLYITQVVWINICGHFPLPQKVNTANWTFTPSTDVLLPEEAKNVHQIYPTDDMDVPNY